MNNRISELFAEGRSGVLSVYFTAGYPALEDTRRVLRLLEASGVDMVEIGMPFSDPLADGPVIQESNMRAIEQGMSLPVLFEQLAGMREEIKMPVVLMGYLNPVLQYREERFLADCARVGVDGLIIPDMPVPYYERYWRESCARMGLNMVMLVTPDTPEERIREIDGMSEGFLYAVSTYGVTGGSGLTEEGLSYVGRLADMGLRNPVMVGFGIRDGASFALAGRHSRGGIVGSAFIRLLGEGVDAERISAWVAEIKKARPK
jgi:tryptophan synthase alpha chain